MRRSNSSGRLASEGPWRRAALIIGIAYPLSTAWVVMATANHYLMDVLAGTATTAVAVAVVELGPKAFRQLKAAAWPAPTTTDVPTSSEA